MSALLTPNAQNSAALGALGALAGPDMMSRVLSQNTGLKNITKLANMVQNFTQGEGDNHLDRIKNSVGAKHFGNLMGAVNTHLNKVHKELREGIDKNTINSTSEVEEETASPSMTYIENSTTSGSEVVSNQKSEERAIDIHDRAIKNIMEDSEKEEKIFESDKTSNLFHLVLVVTLTMICILAWFVLSCKNKETDKKLKQRKNREKHQPIDLENPEKNRTEGAENQSEEDESEEEEDDGETYPQEEEEKTPDPAR